MCRENRLPARAVTVEVRVGPSSYILRVISHNSNPRRIERLQSHSGDRLRSWFLRARGVVQGAVALTPAHAVSNL